MARYSEEVIQNVIESNDIVDVISGYVSLKKAGNSYKGKCPFHNEKTPSFSVSPDKQLYHCFGCGVGGNVITFMMEIENISFLEALELLADRVGITLPKNQSENNEKYQKKEQFYEINRNLANYYFLNLKHNHEAMAYINHRGINQDTIMTFGIGYALNAWRSAYSFFKKKGISNETLVENGIVIKNDQQKYYDRFRNRIMIPILNSRGKIIGFGGRILKDNEHGPKYLNSPDSIIFSKGTELFNLNNAKKNINSDSFIIVEGYMDVIALYQFGIKNVVAALGTAFTMYHAKLLSRYVKEIILCFDGDSAGEKATQRAIQVLSSSSLSIKVIRLDTTEDPDSFIRKYGIEKYKTKIKNAMTAIEYQLMFEKRNISLKTNDGKLKYIDHAIQIIRQSSSSAERELYSKLVAKESGVSAKVIYQMIMNHQQQNIIPELKSVIAQENNVPKAYLQAQESIIMDLLGQKILISDLSCNEDYYSEGFLRNVFISIKDFWNNSQKISLPLIAGQLDKSDQEKLTALVMNYSENKNIDLKENERILRLFYNISEIRRIKIKLKTIESTSPEVSGLLNQLMALKKQVDDVQEVPNG